MTTWEPCIDGKCAGVVRKHRDRVCQECGYAPAPVESARCAETIDLFGGGAVAAPAVNESATSQDAAEDVDVRGQSSDVLWFIMEETGRPFTDNELVGALVARGWSPNSPRARRIDLTDGPLKRMPDGTYQRVPSLGGYLESAGERGGSTLWEATDKAHRWHEAKRKARAA